MSENGSCQSGSQMCHVGGCLVAFATGALIGAGIALIYAPHSGKETRELLAHRAHQTSDKVGEVIHSAKERVEGALHDAKDAIHEKKAEIVAAVAAGREAMHEQRASQSDQS